jgi:hypothetical protein
MGDELDAGQTGRQLSDRGRGPDLAGSDDRGDGGGGDDGLPQKLALGLHHLPGMECHGNFRCTVFGFAPAVHVEGTGDCIPGGGEGGAHTRCSRHHAAVMPTHRIGERIGHGSGRMRRLAADRRR